MIKTGGLIRKTVEILVPFIGLLVLGVNVYAVPPSEIDWKWEAGGEPTFPNEAYGPFTDVDPENIGDNQLFDVWVPDGPGPFPAYIYAHGGGFNGGSKRRMVLSGPLLQNDNVVYVNIHYRLDGTPSLGISDTVLCLEYLKANSQKYKINPEQLFVGGASAGGIIMNDIVYKEKVSGILGIWNWNLYEYQTVDLEDLQLLEKVAIPVVNAHPDPYPSDNSHSALVAFNHSSSNWSAGSPGTFFKAIKEDPSAIGYEDPYVNIEQIWKNGAWIKDSRDGTDTGERMPNLAEWIYSVGILFKINAGLNDAWYNPETDGQGFFITVFPDLDAVSLAWFTYDTELPPEDAVSNLGDAGHRWLVALGPIDGNQSTMEISKVSGGLFDTATEITEVIDGSIVLTFDSCNSATVAYEITSIGESGTVPIRRVANDHSVLCEALRYE